MTEILPKILLVDDNETNRYMIGSILKRAGFEVSTAVDGEAGLAAAAAERPDLILMDVQMPGIDGFEATRRLKAGAETRHVPVIALSAHEARDKAGEIAAAGCDVYLTKPLDFPRLLAEVERLLKMVDGSVPRGAEPARARSGAA